MNTLIAIAGILIAVALQAHLPTLRWLGGGHVELLPALVVYAASTMHRRRALALALVAGLTQDALSVAPSVSPLSPTASPPLRSPACAKLWTAICRGFNRAPAR